MKLVIFTAFLAFFSLSVAAQPSLPASAASRFTAEKELVKKTAAAHGGDKFVKIATLVTRGSVDITSSNFPQAIPATFTMILSGEKYRLELLNPFQPLRQTFDGASTNSTAPGGMTLPPINRLGLPLIAKADSTGFAITSLPENRKKKTGFRITSPEGYFTDFFLDPKTFLVQGYEASYVMNGRQVTTSVVIDKLRMVEGVTLPEKYVQRFDLAQFTVYAEFKAKEILVNSRLDDDVFSGVN